MCRASGVGELTGESLLTNQIRSDRTERKEKENKRKNKLSKSEGNKKSYTQQATKGTYIGWYTRRDEIRQRQSHLFGRSVIGGVQ